MAGDDAVETWYVRARGRIQGPLSWPQLQALRDRGQLARFDQVSRDRQSWAPADSLERLFPRASSGGAFVPAARAKDRGPQRGPEPEPVEFLVLDDDGRGGGGRIAAFGPSGSATDEPSTWYYAESGIPQGPVGFSELKRLARGGRIGAGTLYWTSGLDQWTTGSDIPQLNALWPAGADPGDAAGGVSLPARGQRDSPGQAPAAPRVSPLAMGSLALNLFCGVGNLAAIVVGAMALRQIARSDGAVAGKKLAVAGVVLGTTGLILSALAGVWYFWKGIGPG